MSANNESGRRLWRVRKRHDHIDATLAPTAGRWELAYAHNDKPMVVWRYTEQHEAQTDAEARRRQLERAGWTNHW